MNDFIGSLRHRLQQSLPGIGVQKQMMAAPITGDKFRSKQKGQPKRGGVTILLYPHEGLWHLPLMKRPDYQGIHSGQISLPGGKMETQDTDLIDTALRETAEEVGVDIPRGQVIGMLSPLHIIASHYEVLPVVAYLDHPPEFHIDPREVQSLIVTTINHLLLPDTVKRKEIKVRGMEISAPYFDVANEVVWGATAMMLNELLTVIREMN